ncbi:hypothetical protein SAMN04487969_102504 [Paenibacillus algorifonticola]|uniref:Uncharacterized protein n=1 Tax=Paenibacillus algorifonticola TaxID=684063 RepID=A0A1I2AL18_9BACL|nr:hypothetical protein [Paenibacillus algorifonticola]SFE43570.1 hypothetical protein SAMN04487969_102504 [Paenibacillus algorifonticola]
MFGAFARVTTTADNTGDLKKILDGLADVQVYVGVPEGGGDHGGGISNAELLYIQSHGVRSKSMREEMNPDIESGRKTYSQAYEMYIQSHGSPLWHIPPRPVLEPAIEANKDKISKQMQRAAQAALDGNDIGPELHKVGMMGQNIARGWFVDPRNGWEPNSPLTVAKKGSDRPLISTGELRKSIQFVIEDGNS